MTAMIEEQVTPMDVVDDIELLAILGIPTMPVSILDWDDLPELSEEEEEDDNNSVTTQKNKRRYEDDLFAELDFVEVPITKRTKQEDDLSLDLSLFNSNYAELVMNEEDIRLALDLITTASTPSTPS